MPHSLTISNTGAANLAISSVGIVGSGADTFSAVPGGPNPCPTLTPIVEPGRSCTLNVTFSPATAMKRSAILRVSLGSLNAQPIDVPLSGTGFDSLNVITPNGGELIPSGSTYSIRWTAPPSAVTFDLKYSVNGGTTWKSISDKVTGSSYDWHAPVPSGDKTGYLVKVLGYDAGGKSVGEDVSDSVFNMEIVKITSPHGGEILESGNIRSIKWQTNATVRPVGSVRLFYSMNGGLSWKSIKTVKGNTGSYDWTVPEVSGPNSGCRVKILLKDAGGTTVGSAISKGLFTIQQ